MTHCVTPSEGSIPAGARSSQASVALDWIAGRTSVTRCHSPAPVKLLTPMRKGDAAWVYMSSYGGGLVAGDRLDLQVDLGPDAIGVLTTQASTKVYHQQDGVGAKQRLTANVADGATLIVAPDPVTCYADARYDQKQRFDLHPDASLVLLDWFTAGRLATGERWAFDRYRTENTIRIDGRVVASDRLGMDRSARAIDGPFCTGRYNCLATVIMVGPAFRQAIDSMDPWARALPLPQRALLPISFSRMAWGGILRIAGMGAEPVRAELETRLAFVEDLIGDGLWHRKW